MATYYVDNLNGDNANDGSSANPWETIDYSSTQLAVNDTLIVRLGTGTYTHTPSFTFFSSLGGVTYEAELDQYGKQQVVLDGGAVSLTTWTNEFRPYNATLKNFIFENYRAANTDGGFIRCNSALSPVFENNIFRKWGLGTTSGGGYRGGFFSGNTNSGSPLTVTLQNNVFYDIGLETGAVDGSFFSTRNANLSTITAYGNIFVYTASPTYGTGGLIHSQIDPGSNSGSFTFRNNIFYCEYASPVDFIVISGETFNGLTFTHNVLDNVNLPTAAGTAVVTDNISTTVYFKNTATGNFNLRPDLNSSILGAGIQI